MTNQRKSIHITEHEEQKNRFILENIKPQKKRERSSLFNQLMMVLVFALVFGFVAGGVFVLSRTYFPWERVVSKISVTSKSIRTKDSESSLVSDQVQAKDLEILNEYEQAAKQVAQVGKQASDAVVGVFTSDLSKTDNELSPAFPGMVIFQDETYYYILTEYDAASVEEVAVVMFHNGCKSKAEVIGKNKSLDLAVLGVKVSSLSKSDQQSIGIVSVNLSDSPKLGSLVVFVGKPCETMYSVLNGQVVQDDQAFVTTDYELRRYGVLTQAQPKASGFVLDVSGKLVGYITSAFGEHNSLEHQTFIGCYELIRDIDAMLQGENAVYLGIKGTSVSKIRAQENDIRAGVYVSEVIEQSPAYESGLRSADVITQVDSQKIKDFGEFRQMVSSHRSGDTMRLIVSRKNGGESRTEKLSLTIQ